MEIPVGVVFEHPEEDDWDAAEEDSWGDEQAGASLGLTR